MRENGFDWHEIPAKINFLKVLWGINFLVEGLLNLLLQRKMTQKNNNSVHNSLLLLKYSSKFTSKAFTFKNDKILKVKVYFFTNFHPNFNKLKTSIIFKGKNRLHKKLGITLFMKTIHFVDLK